MEPLLEDLDPWSVEYEAAVDARRRRAASRAQVLMLALIVLAVLAVVALAAAYLLGGIASLGER